MHVKNLKKLSDYFSVPIMKPLDCTMHRDQADYTDGVAQVMSMLCNGVQKAGNFLALHGAGMSIIPGGNGLVGSHLNGTLC